MNFGVKNPSLFSSIQSFQMQSFGFTPLSTNPLRPMSRSSNHALVRAVDPLFAKSLAHWSHGGLECWAVSDTNPQEMQLFKRDYEARIVQAKQMWQCFRVADANWRKSHDRPVVLKNVIFAA